MQDIQRKLLDAVIPLWRIAYNKQLQLKYHRNASILMRFANKIVDLESQAGITAMIHRLTGHHLCCPLEPTRPSPITEGYRNKNTFSVGTGPNGNRKTVGYFIGNWKRGNVVCVPADGCKNVSNAHLRVSKAYAEFLKRSPLDTMLDLKGAGCWRDCTVRSTREGALMAVIACSAKNLSPGGFQEALTSLQEFFVEGDGQDCGLTSLYVQASERTRATNEEAPYKLLYGDPYLTETLLDLKFHISPDSFFQINTMAAEVLYSTVKELGGVTKGTTLLDVCCGTGTIGLVMANSVKDVLGVEVIPQAIQDAQLNAKLNNITNTKFVCGPAEEILPKLIPAIEGSIEDIVVVANPARAGLHRKVIAAIRNCPSLHKIIYISCKPDGSAFDNFIDLCCPSNSKLQGSPFIPTRAVPVDMFPHTYHCELVIVFER